MNTQERILLQQALRELEEELDTKENAEDYIDKLYLRQKKSEKTGKFSPLT